MAFDIKIYNKLILKARFKIAYTQRNFNEYDIVHDLFLLDDVITTQNMGWHITRAIKIESSKSVNFILTHKIFDDTYICSKCKEPKPVGAFRLRNENRNTYFDYINDTCTECERRLIKEYHNQHKSNIEYKEKAKNRANNWHWSNRKLVLQYQKQRRLTEEYKQYRREYNTKNRDKIRLQAKEARIARRINSKKAA